jgi:ribosome-binding factor A
MSDRIYKINELIKEEISQIILREMGDHEGIVTVTAVETTPDLRHATIWYGLIDGNIKDIEEILASKEKTFQQILNKRLSMKHVPKINFRYDKSGEYMEKINKLIDEANEDRR